MNADKIIQYISSLDFVKDFVKQFPKSGLHLVGGAVRDIILGIETADFDLVAENIELDELHDFLVRYGKVKMIESRAFGVLKFKPNLDCHSELDSESQRSRNKFGMTGGNECLIFDVALARKEEYNPGMRKKHAKVEHKNISIIDDLARRDFTVNAMALKLVAGSLWSVEKTTNYKPRTTNYLIDPYHGLSDIKNKIIRAVGDPEERFMEDPTRILRAIRFALKFGFKIEPKTMKAMTKLAPEVIRKFENEKGRPVPRVSYEMIGAEFIKTFELDPDKTINLYDEIGLLKLIFPKIEDMKGVEQPDIFHAEGDVFIHTLLTLKNLPKNATLTTKLAALLHDIGKPSTFSSREMTGDRIRFHDHDKIGQEMSADVLGRIKMPKKLVDDVSWLVREHMKIFFAFPKMKIERQKALVRNPLFDQLLILARADTLSSLRPDGRPDLGIMPKIEKIVGSIREEDQGKPIEIINGHEIMQVILESKPDFDPAKEGKKIGKLKKEINSLYDRGEIQTKKEALAKLDHLINKNC